MGEGRCNVWRDFISVTLSCPVSQEKKLEKELDRMGAAAVGYASSRLKPLVLARSSNRTTPLMAALGCPSVESVNLVSG